MTLGELVNVVGFKVKDGDVAKVNKTISSIKSTAAKLLGAIGIGISLTQLNALAEEFGGIGDRIAYAVSESEAMGNAQKRIFDAAQNCKTAYGAMADEVLALKAANEGLFPLDDAIMFTQTMNRLGKVANLDNSAIASMNSIIQKAISSGQLGATELARLGQIAPASLKALADGIGVSQEKLKQMAASGQLTASVIKDAMLKSANDIGLAYDQMGYNVSDALLHVRNQFGFWVAETDKMFNITNTVGGLMVKGFDKLMGVLDKVRNGFKVVVDAVGGTTNFLKLLAIVAGSIYLAFNFPKIISGIKNIITTLMSVDPRILAIIAILIMLGLIIDDIINFAKGNNSVLGEMFKKAGIDAEDMRKKVKNTFENLKKFVKNTFDSVVKILKTFFAPVKAALASLFGPDAFATLGNAIATIIGWFEKLSEFLANNKIASTIAALAVVFGMLATPIGQVVIAIGALIVIVDLLIKAWNAAKEAVTKIWDTIKTTAERVFGAIKDFLDEHFSGVFNTITSVWNSIKDAVVSVWETIKGAALEIWGILQQFWEEHGQQVYQAFSNIWQGIKDRLSAIWNAIKTAAIAVWTVIKVTLGVIWGVISTVAQTIFNNLKAFWDTWGAAILAAFTLVWNTIKAVFEGVWNAIKTIFQTALNVLADLFAIFAAAFAGDWGTAWENVKQLFSDIWNGIVSFFGGILESIVNIATTYFESLKSYLSAVWEGIKSTASSVWNAIQTAIITPVTNAVNSVIQWFNTAKTNIVNTINSIKSSVTSIFNAIKTAITTPIESAVSFVKSGIEAIKSAFNFSWSLPPLKLPHISVSGGTPPYGIGGVGSLPKFSIQWYKKGGILNQPTIFGKMGGTLLGGGEAGKEAVIPLSELWKNMRIVMGDALTRFGSNMMAFAGGPAVPQRTVSTVNNTTNSSRTIIMRVDMTNQFNGERAAQRDASRAMKSASNDLTEELARALDYTK